MKVTLVDDIKYIWRYSTYVVQYIAASFAGVWLVLNEQQRLDLLGLVGITPTVFAGVSVLVLVIATMTARGTKLEFKPPTRDDGT
jgi:hypothetical protein